MPTAHDSTFVLMGSQSSMVIPTPDTVDGETLLLIGLARGSSNVGTPPPGFDPAINAQTGTGASDVRCVVYSKSAASEPVSHTIGWAANTFGIGFGLSIADTDPLTPINVILGLPDIASDATFDCPSVETTVDGTLLIHVGGMSVSGGLAAGNMTPSDGTELEDPGSSIGAGARIAAAMAVDDAPIAGATAPVTWTVGGAVFGRALGITIAIQAAVLIADAGADQNADPGQLVTLDGSGSANALTWQWTQTGGTPDVTDYLGGDDTAEATFYAPQGPAVLTFQLEVGDGVDTETDTCDVTLTAPNPAAPLVIKHRQPGGAWV